MRVAYTTRTNRDSKMAEVIAGNPVSVRDLTIPQCCVLRYTGALYVSESGSDESGLGTEDKPFKTILQVCFNSLVWPDSFRFSVCYHAWRRGKSWAT